ncbi:Hypothetical_protein [Hexamita inflata]|uniref:Hypothetical_protein n=1 Tax=Hexamita inflata TaxID=28002 RepID=A0AA86QIK8_9EUKA|nr:Hypothetical protein HINF_LOCUS44516 [Hexamita inflata]
MNHELQELNINAYYAIKNLLDTLGQTVYETTNEIPPELVVRFGEVVSFMKFFDNTLTKEDIKLVLLEMNVIVNSSNTAHVQGLFKYSFVNSQFRDNQWEYLKRVHIYNNKHIAQFTIFKISFIDYQLAIKICQDTDQPQEFVQRIYTMQNQVQNDHQPLI